MLPDRAKVTIRTWLQSISAPTRLQIRTVCTDMCAAYLAAVQEIVPRAAIVIDRFQVAQHYRNGADSLRKQELKRVREHLSNVGIPWQVQEIQNICAAVLFVRPSS